LDRSQDHLVHRAIVAKPTPPVHRPATTGSPTKNAG
jgi:hypothetical protein